MMLKSRKNLPSFSARPTMDQLCLLFIKSVHFLLQCPPMVTLVVTTSKCLRVFQSVFSNILAKTELYVYAKIQQAYFLQQKCSPYMGTFL